MSKSTNEVKVLAENFKKVCNLLVTKSETNLNDKIQAVLEEYFNNEYAVTDKFSDDETVCKKQMYAIFACNSKIGKLLSGDESYMRPKEELIHGDKSAFVNVISELDKRSFGESGISNCDKIISGNW